MADADLRGKRSSKPAKKHAKLVHGSSTVSPARREAYAILLAIESALERGRSAHADELLRAPRVSALSAQDRHLCTALVMGVLRWQICLDRLIKPLLAKPNARMDMEVRVALRLGALQLLFMDRIPAHAAIGESVAMAKSGGHKFASGMVNAVLRKLALQPRPSSTASDCDGPQELAAATGHPAWMVERWVSNYGIEAARAICAHGQRQPEPGLRLLEAQLAPHLEVALQSEQLELAPGLLLTAARRLRIGDLQSADLTSTKAFHSGQVRIQDEGSQLIAELAGHGERILDCCAAPGGKTLILAERNPTSRITACEIDPARFEAMRQRFAESPQLGAERIELLQADASLGDVEGAFDLILADVPCSGTGTLGRNPEIRHSLEANDLERHHQRQCAILQGALNIAGAGLSLSKDGAIAARSVRVLYSTCSLEPEENAAVVAEVLASNPAWELASLADRVDELQSEGRLAPGAADMLQRLIASDGSLMLLPGSSDGGNDGKHISDGFFAAMLQRRGGKALEAIETIAAIK